MPKLSTLTLCTGIVLALPLSACSQLQIKWLPKEAVVTPATPLTEAPAPSQPAATVPLALTVPALTVPTNPITKVQTNTPQPPASPISSQAKPTVTYGNASGQPVKLLNNTTAYTPANSPNPATSNQVIQNTATPNTAPARKIPTHMAISVPVILNAPLQSTAVPDTADAESNNPNNNPNDNPNISPNSTPTITPVEPRPLVPTPQQPGAKLQPRKPAVPLATASAAIPNKGIPTLRTDAISLDHSMEEIAAIDIVNEFCPDMIDPKAMPRFRAGMMRILAGLLPPGKDPFVLLSALRQDPQYLAALDQAREDSAKFTVAQNKDACLDIVLSSTATQPT